MKSETFVRRCSVKKVFLEILQNLQENNCARDSFLKNILWYRCFPVNFAKYLRTPFWQNISGWLLLLRDYFTLRNKYSQRTFNLRSYFKQILQNKPNRWVNYFLIQLLTTWSFFSQLFIAARETFLLIDENDILRI